MPVKQNPVITTIEKDGKELNVYFKIKEQSHESINDLTNQMIPSPLGFEVPIKELVEVKKGKTSDTITHRDGKIYAEVSAQVKQKTYPKWRQACKKKWIRLSCLKMWKYQQAA